MDSNMFDILKYKLLATGWPTWVKNTSAPITPTHMYTITITHKFLFNLNIQLKKKINKKTLKYLKEIDIFTLIK